MTFYLNKDNEQLGPFTTEQIQKFLAHGLLRPSDRVRVDGQSTWLAIENVPELAQSKPSVETTYASPAPAQAYQPDYPHTSSLPRQESGKYAQGKSPVIACVLSLFIVGTGQFYNGDWGKGWFLLITCIIASICSLGTLWFLWALMSVIDAYMVAAKRRPLGGSFFNF